MSDNATPKKPLRKIPRIVFDRPAFSLKRFLLVFALGVVASFVMGWVLSGMERRDKFFHWPASDVSLLGKHWPYVVPVIVVGVLASVAFGLAWKRAWSPRIEMVEVQPVPRRGRRFLFIHESTELSRR